MAHLIPNIKQKYFDENGEPLAGGKLYSYAAGTSTPLATYTDQSEDESNPNPTILDANGEADIWIGASAYKFVLADPDENILWTVDNVTHIGNGSVAEANLADDAVATDKIQDGAVTQDKLAAKNLVTRSLTFPTTSATSAQAVSGTLAITTTGRPVMLGLIGQDSSGTPAKLKVSAPSNKDAIAIVNIKRGASLISVQRFGFRRTFGSAALGTYTSSGSLTIARTGTIIIEGCGGGGGGSGGGGSGGGGGGGGSSSHPPVVKSVTAGEVLTITIGSGGAGGAGGSGGGASSAGGTGNDTVVSSDLQGEIYRAQGATGGGVVSDGSVSSTGGAAGVTRDLGADGGAGGNDAGANGGSNSSAGSTGGRAKFNGVYAGAAGGAGGTGNSGFGGGGGGGASSAYGQGGIGEVRNGVTQRNATGYGSGGGGGGGGDNGSAGGPGGNGAGGYLQILDPGAGSGGTVFSEIPASAIQHLDAAPSEDTHNYTLEVYVTDGAAEFSTTGAISLLAHEL